MNYINAKELERRIIEQNEIIKAGGGKSLCFFGSGDDCVKMLKWFLKKGLILPVAICDNNPEKQGTHLEHIPIISFQKALDVYEEIYVLITSTMYGDEMEEQVVKQVEKSQVLNIAPFFRGLISNQKHSEEVQERMAYFKAYLRGESEEKVSFRLSEDMPEHANEVVRQLAEYQEAYDRGEYIILDERYLNRNYDFWEDIIEETDKNVSLCDWMNQENVNGIYKVGTSPSYLMNYSNCNFTDEKVEGVAKHVIEFHHYLNNREIPFLYVQFPNKVSPVEKEIPLDNNNGENDCVTRILDKMRDNYVQVLDYRQVMIERGIDYRESFFRTDHHWKPSTAFEATREVCVTLEKITNISFDYDKLDRNQYETIVYPNIYLGSQGQRTGVLYGGLDDFELILPKYETDYTWSCKEKGFQVRGSAMESLLLIPHLDWAYYEVNPYAVYSLVNKGQCTIVNHKAKETQKAICINDSFSNPVASFLAPQFSELHFVDIRGELNKNDVYALIEEVKPDVVMILCNVSSTRGMLDKHWE